MLNTKFCSCCPIFSIKKDFGIRIGRSDNIERRKRILIDRFNEIEEHNRKYRAGESSYELALNDISHLSNEELAQQKTGLLPKPANYSDNSLPADQDTKRGGRASPAAFDWRNGENFLMSFRFFT